MVSDSFPQQRPRPLKVVKANCQGGFGNKIAEMTCYAYNCCADVVAICETHLASEPEVDGWRWFGKNRENRAGGDVCVLVRKRIACRELRNPRCDDCEAIWVEVSLTDFAPIVVGSVNVRPKDACGKVNVVGMHNSAHDVSKALGRHCRLLVCGGWNSRIVAFGDSADNALGKIFADFVSSENLYVCNVHGVVTRPDSASIIDFTLATPVVASCVRGWRTITEDNFDCDHLGIVFEVSWNPAVCSNAAPHASNISSCDWKLFREAFDPRLSLWVRTNADTHRHSFDDLYSSWCDTVLSVLRR